MEQQTEVSWYGIKVPREITLERELAIYRLALIHYKKALTLPDASVGVLRELGYDGRCIDIAKATNSGICHYLRLVHGIMIDDLHKLSCLYSIFPPNFDFHFDFLFSIDPKSSRLNPRIHFLEDAYEICKKMLDGKSH